MLGPILEVDEAALRGELPFVVVDPVTWERARTGRFELGAPVRVDREAERRPRGRRADLEERRVRDGPWRRCAGAAAGSLHEFHVVGSNLWVALDRRVGRGGERHLLRAESQRRRTDLAAAAVSEAGDARVPP